MSNSVDVLAWIREASAAIDRVYGVQAQLPMESARVLNAVAELLEADRAVDVAEAALTRFEMAGPRHGGGPGTIWEFRDAEIKRKTLEACEIAHARRKAALNAISDSQGLKPE